jgi:hypothetical protein
VLGFLTDHRCGSGLQAVITAAMMVRTGAADVVVAGGVECAADELGLFPMACLRIMTTTLHELARTKGAYGLEAIALGHDHGIAALFESAGTTPLAITPRGARFHGIRRPVARADTAPESYFVRGREWKPRPSSCAPIHAASSDLLSGT